MHKLAFNDQPLPATVVIGVKANGVDLGQQTSRLQIRAVNDVPTGVTDDECRVTDRSGLFAAFVNENSPVVEVILKEALQWGAVGHFDRYQRSTDDVRMQVFAIWNVLQRHNVKYSSITTPSGFSEKVQGMVGIGNTSPTATLTVLGPNGTTGDAPTVLQVTGGMVLELTGGFKPVGVARSRLKQVSAAKRRASTAAAGAVR